MKLNICVSTYISYYISKATLWNNINSNDARNIFRWYCIKFKTLVINKDVSYAGASKTKCKISFDRTSKCS